MALAQHASVADAQNMHGGHLRNRGLPRSPLVALVEMKGFPLGNPIWCQLMGTKNLPMDSLHAQDFKVFRSLCKKI